MKGFFKNPLNRKIITIFTFLLIIIIILFSSNYIIISENFSDPWFARVASVATALASIFALLVLYFTYRSLAINREMINEMRSQSSPAVTVKIIPDKDNFNMLNLSIKNTGGGPAYDINVTFDPDLPYEFSNAKTLNNLIALKNMPLLEKGEEVQFFYRSAISFKEDNSSSKISSSNVTITYYSESISDNPQRIQFVRKYLVNILETEGQLYVSRKNFHNLVDEINEVKQGLFILLKDIQENQNEKRNGKRVKSIRRFNR
ncbi:MAG: hypothetical protein A2499_07205 [Stygiobacter sp. RIFOXYC12_FULL_38_8]|nr:MAG: hypothetical protein A2X62_05255 [Stygiobacter sp. GWC2_38_9]OGU84090.1 MAG: hypothetical protein A2279_09940 [Stygiobacter sp. RIFOXYA12_FULL_38_9]OGV09624.1 MAG: hypothetical protein A2299_00805 [Stygiobacter sp. RIFOXYB2_FULL_37_11]OGV16754.1 MAG: hypothetical protein A2440_05275 [Stygiobacter sp. RIFOXYC2_FULL_38_25]OGV18113.1 MAG: hypothetical protein A2237_06250 [Stygiobacter sp. RIFOXYA2_FULL_38_8]OGV25167.1 MAG: hypothetical protein A2499_07205 [Stygiobacter sp. RIFOXYC12_FULL_